MAGLFPDKPKTDDRAFTHGSGGAAADSAVEGRVKLEDRHVDTPHARVAKRPLKDNEKHDQLAAKERRSESRQEALIDESLEESFPSSDPPSAKHIT